MELFYTGRHVINICSNIFKSVLKMPLFLFLPKGYIVSVGAKRWVNVNEVYTFVGYVFEFNKAIPAIDSVGLEFHIRPP